MQQWSFQTMLGADIHGSTLGILGMGRIGQGIARRGAHGFGMKVLYHNRSQLPAATEAEVGATYVDLDTLLAQSDHLLLVLSASHEDLEFTLPGVEGCSGWELLVDTGDDEARESRACGEKTLWQGRSLKLFKCPMT